MAATADVLTVPEWVEKNSNLFKTLPVGFDPHSVPRKRVLGVGERDAIVAAILKPATRVSVEGLDATAKSKPLQGLDAGISSADVTNEDMGNIDLPVGHQPSDYWKDVENHGNILVTLISTARRKSGFIPSVSGAEFTKKEAEEYANKFSAWMKELDSYVGYVHLVDWVEQTTKNDTTDCKVVLNGVADFVLAVAGMAAGPLAKKLAARIKGLITSAANYATQRGSAVNAGFTLETTDTTGVKDPIQAISFTSTVMSKTKSGKGVSEESTIKLASFVYKLNSNAIISMAERLAAGSTLSGSKQYRDYVNSPIKNFKTSHMSAN